MHSKHSSAFFIIKNTSVPGGTFETERRFKLKNEKYGMLSDIIINSSEIKLKSIALFHYMKFLEKNSKNSSNDTLSSDKLTSCSSKDLRHLRKQ